jgi:hypothetical protein
MICTMLIKHVILQLPVRIPYTSGNTDLKLQIPQQADYIFSQSVKILGLI